MDSTFPYTPKNKIRFVTATALFDGHDASINIMRRLLQQGGAEVIHLGHNRSVQDIVNAIIQEDAFPCDEPHLFRERTSNERFQPGFEFEREEP